MSKYKQAGEYHLQCVERAMILYNRGELKAAKEAFLSDMVKNPITRSALRLSERTTSIRFLDRGDFPYFIKDNIPL